MALPPWAPPPAAVAPHLRQFIKTREAQQQEDFTASTKIRLAEVQRAIGSVTDDVVAAVGADLHEDLHEHAASVTAIGAAAEAVIDHDLDLHRQLQALYESRLKRLVVVAIDARDGVIDGAVTIPATGNFPPPFDASRRAF